MTTTSPDANGATVLRNSLLDCGIRVCFANPGTSEMHFVAALDGDERMRCVLGLQENVVTGAADGYGRMTGAPAATLLHLGPGLANGLANLHNARRARTPVVNIVGDHASSHLALDAPLTSDVEGLARPMSDFVLRIPGPDDVARSTCAAVAAARRAPGIATLILPADTAWGTVSPQHRSAIPPADPRRGLADGADEASRALRQALASGRRVGLLLSGAALRGRALELAGAVSGATGARLLCESLSARIERGAGRVAVEKIPYPAAQAAACLHGIDFLLLVAATVPVAFFAYPGSSGQVLRPDTEVAVLCLPGQDAEYALDHLLGQLAATPALAPVERATFSTDHGADRPLGVTELCEIVAAGLPDDAIVCDEALTAMATLHAATVGAAPHDYLQNTGGSIGIGPPLAIGAALACPGRKVINVQADGSAMYTIQALWTQARERLNVLTIILSNRSYAILHHEMRNVGISEPGINARRMLNLDDPEIDFCQLAVGMGVEAVRVRTAREFAQAYARGLRSSLPFLIDAVL